MNEGNGVPPADGPRGTTGTAPTAPTPPPPPPSDGDFELAKPTPAAPPGTPEEAEGETGGQAGSETGGQAEGEAGRAAGETAVPGSGERAQAERVTPLHDPDPYSTPPYGQPGPWAPAPPVQHPAVTPAHGTAVPAPPTPPTAPVLSVPQGTPAPQAPGSTTALTPQTPVPATPPAPQSAAPVPVPAPAPRMPAPDPAPPAAVPPVPEGGADPWAGYDPWAAAQAREPLQQTGAKVLTPAQRKRRAWRWVIGWTLVVAVVSGGTGGVVGAYVEREGHGGQPGSVPAGRAPDSVAGIAARALPSVVTLHVRGDGAAGTGTGFVLDAQGHILTNNHVVEPAGPDGEISVTFSSGDTVKAEVVGRDGGYDLAVVQVHGVHGLTPLPLGDSDDVRVGDPVVAIGAPFDLADTVTSGIISAKERPITAGGEKSDGSDVSYVDALQTDAPINPGNSGGPLLDSHARVIGINSAIRSAGGGSGTGGGQAGSIGLGFAIPVNQAKRVAEELIGHGHATHPVIGVTLDMGYTGDGARIDDKGANGGPAVTRGGPGDRAGLEPGDVVTEADGARVHSGRELIVKIRSHRPGDRLRLTVDRDGTEREVSVVLGAAEQN
ncbi:S1C family serine protease [Streptomyces achromogenes]|uniref:S1C family serine protease n=1 Tax=Streptomyces achromogenes TaxID=67255 RepID=UPI0036F86C95